MEAGLLAFVKFYLMIPSLLMEKFSTMEKCAPTILASALSHPIRDIKRIVSRTRIERLRQATGATAT